MTELGDLPAHATASSLVDGPRVFRSGRGSVNRWEVQKLLRPALLRAGLDLDRLEEFKRQNDAELRKAMAKFRAASDERVQFRQDALEGSAESWIKTMEGRRAFAPSSAFYAVSTADVITATQGIDLRAENIAPFNNSAEVTWGLDTDDVGQFSGQIIFRFIWDNPTGQACVNITTALGINAWCKVFANASLVPLDTNPPASVLDVYAALGIREISNGQVLDPLTQSNQVQHVLRLPVIGSWFDSRTASQDLFMGCILDYQMLAVPPNGRVLFDVACKLDWWAYNGLGQFDANGGGRKVTAYGVWIELIA